MTATAVSEIIPGWREDELPVHDKLDRDLLLRAYRFSEEAHRGQVRKSGDPYFCHPASVAGIFSAPTTKSRTEAKSPGSQRRRNERRNVGVDRKIVP